MGTIGITATDDPARDGAGRPSTSFTASYPDVAVKLNVEEDCQFDIVSGHLNAGVRHLGEE